MRSQFQHKKSLGQHFLKDSETAKEIVDALQPFNAAHIILEIGPGLGILSRHLVRLGKEIYFSELDLRIIQFLKNDLKIDGDHIIEGDFLKISLDKIFSEEVMIIGNFPYSISSQILFKVLEFKQIVPVVVGMFQKEMARRVVAKHNNKDYGVITVLVQAFYDCEYLFELKPVAFDPPPKVESAVIRLKRKTITKEFDERMFREVVKTAFNQRRKKLSNAMKGMMNSDVVLKQFNFSDKRAEQLSVDDFISMTIAFSQLNKKG